jgi:hypothetical protein
VFQSTPAKTGIRSRQAFGATVSIHAPRKGRRPDRRWSARWRAVSIHAPAKAAQLRKKPADLVAGGLILLSSQSSGVARQPLRLRFFNRCRRMGESGGAAADLFSKKIRPVAAIHYRNRSDSFQSRHKAGAGNRRVAMASCRSKLRIAVRALVKTRERTQRRVRRRTLSAHR